MRSLTRLVSLACAFSAVAGCPDPLDDGVDNGDDEIEVVTPVVDEVELAMSQGVRCLRAQSLLQCWGRGSSTIETVEDVLDVESSGSSVCLVRGDGSLWCGTAFPLAESLQLISAGPFVAAGGPQCALRAHGTLFCNSDTAPAGAFVAHSGTCGMRADGDVVCAATKCEALESVGGSCSDVTDCFEQETHDGYGCSATTDGITGEAIPGTCTFSDQVNCVVVEETVLTNILSFDCRGTSCCGIEAESGEVRCSGAANRLSGRSFSRVSLLSDAFGIRPCGVRLDGSAACVAGGAMVDLQGTFRTLEAKDVPIFGPAFCALTVNGIIQCNDEPPPFDRDEDGVFDSVDNCVDTSNPDQADADADGAGDACP